MRAHISNPKAGGREAHWEQLESFTPPVTHLLFFPNSSTNGEPTIQIYELMGTVLIQTIIAYNSTSRGSDTFLPLWALGIHVDKIPQTKIKLLKSGRGGTHL